MSCTLKFNKAWLVAKGPEWTFPVRVFYEPNPVNRLKARSAARKLRNELNAGESFDKVPKPVHEPHLLRMSRFHVVQIPLEYLGDQVGDELLRLKQLKTPELRQLILSLNRFIRKLKLQFLNDIFSFKLSRCQATGAIGGRCD